MDIGKIKEIVQEILDYVATIPDEYRVATYETLLRHRLLGSEAALGERRDEEKDSSWDLVIPMGVKAFLKANGMNEQVLKKLFIAEKNTIAKFYKLKTTKKVTAQIQIACLTALEHALQDGVFRFAIEEIRQRLKDEKCYDKDHFSGVFTKHEHLFKNLSDPTSVELSQEGMTKLAETITEMIK